MPLGPGKGEREIQLDHFQVNKSYINELGIIWYLDGPVADTTGCIFIWEVR